MIEHCLCVHLDRILRAVNGYGIWAAADGTTQEEIALAKIEIACAAGAGGAVKRCIMLDEHGRRCRRKASVRSKDCYLCRRHATPWHLLMIADQYSWATRQMLADAAWDTTTEGQALINTANRRSREHLQ